MKAGHSSSGLVAFSRKVFVVACPTLLSERWPGGLAPMGASRRLKETAPSTDEHQAQGWVEPSPSARDATVRLPSPGDFESSFSSRISRISARSGRFGQRDGSSRNLME